MALDRKDIESGDIFGGLGESADKARDKVSLLENSMEFIKELAKATKKALSATDRPSTAPKLREENEEFDKANVLANERIKLDRQLATAQAKLATATKGEREELAKTRLEQSRLNKEAKQSVELQSENTGAYRKAALELAKVKRELKDASVASDKNEEELDELRATYNKLNKAIRGADQSVGDFSRNVGNYNNKLDGLGESVEGVGDKVGGLISGGKGSFKSLGGSISGFFSKIGGHSEKLKGLGDSVEGVGDKIKGLDDDDGDGDGGGILGGFISKIGPWGVAIGAAVGGAFALADAISEIDQEFDKLRGTIAQLTGVEGDMLDRMTVNIKALETTFDADVNESLRATNILMREFGLEGDEATNLLKQGLLSNANIQGDLLEGVIEYTTQIKAAGGDADDLFKILEASGTAGVFSDKGIDTVKEFGLSIREQTQATSDALIGGFGKKFTEDLFKGINEGSISTIEALQIVTEKLEATDLSAKQRQTIIADVFKGAGEDAGSFLETLTEINFETAFQADLSGDMAKKKQKEFEANQKLAAAQNRLSKAIGDSSAVGRLWTNIQAEVIDKLVGVVKWVGNVIEGFEMLGTEPEKGMRKLASAIVDILFFPINKVIEAINWIISWFTDYQIPTIELPTEEVNDFTEAQRKNISVSERAQRAIKGLGSAVRGEMKTFQKRIDLLEKGNLTDEARIKLVDELNSRYPELLENYDLENLSKQDAVDLSNELQRTLIEEEILKNKRIVVGKLENEIAERRAKLAVLERQDKTAGIKKLQEEIKWLETNGRAQINAIEEEVRVMLGLSDRTDDATDSNKNLEDSINDLAGSTEKAVKPIEEYSVAVSTATEALNDASSSVEKIKTELDELDASYKKTLQTFKTGVEIEIAFGDLLGIPNDEAVKSALKRQLDFVEKHLSNLENLNQEDRARYAQAVKDIEATQDKFLRVLTDSQSRVLIETERQLIESGATRLEIDRALTLQKIANLEELMEAQIEFNEETIKTELKLAKERAKLSKIGLSEFTNEQKKQFKERELQLLNDGETQLKIAEELRSLKIEQLEDEIEKRRELGLETLDQELELAKLRQKQIEDESKAQEDALKEAAERRNQIIEAATDRFLELADKRIDKINEEIDAAQSQADFFADLAAEGNIKAEQSLAEQNQIIAEKQAEKARIEQQKQNIELVSSILTAYNNALGAGKSAPEALTEAFTGAATIKAFIAAFPAFLDGTENTGNGHGSGVDGLGGFKAILHPNERVFTSGQNQRMGDYSNNEAADILHNYSKNDLPIEYIETSTNNIDFSKIESKLDKVVKVIEEKPNIQLGEISSMAMAINESKKVGNRTTTNRFIVK